MIDHLGMNIKWDTTEQWVSPVAYPLARGNMQSAPRKQRRREVSLKQVPPLVAANRAGYSYTCADKCALYRRWHDFVAMVRDMSMVLVVFHTMKSWFELSVRLRNTCCEY